MEILSATALFYVQGAKGNLKTAYVRVTLRRMRMVMSFLLTVIL